MLLTRRDFVAALGAAGLSVVASASMARTSFMSNSAAYPFALGVASGPGIDNGLVLWTRLLPIDWAQGGLITASRVPVRWELAEDAAFRRIAARGRTEALDRLGHSVHVEVAGLKPGQRYFYRFHAAEATSPVGCTRTLPETSAVLAHWRLAFASCQHYEQGYFGAYRAMLNDAPDAVLFLGDYIYESGAHAQRFRPHPTPAVYDLPGYRARYALYRSDAALQAMHAHCPWLVIWDDHEVINDYAGLSGGAPHRDFAARRRAAYQAWYEHMPVPRAVAMQGYAQLQIQRVLHYGDLASIYLLDGRQFRDPQACSGAWRGGRMIDPAQCSTLNDPSRSLLGQAQEQWLGAQLTKAARRWNIIAQPTLFTPLRNPTASKPGVWNDGWDGYPQARARLIAQLAQDSVLNPLILGGDVHANWVCDVPRDGLQAGRQEIHGPRRPIVAAEFCGTSISAHGGSMARARAVADANPQVHLVDTLTRGYGLLTLDANTAKVTLRGIDDARQLSPRAFTIAQFEVQAGRAGILSDSSANRDSHPRAIPTEPPSTAEPVAE